MDWLSYVALTWAALSSGAYVYLVIIVRKQLAEAWRDYTDFEAALEGDLSDYVRSLNREAAE